MMGRKSALALIASIFIINEVWAIELLANYKYWKSTSDQIVYDYSGNSRHGSIIGTYYATDRGLAANDFYYPNLMGYAFVVKNEYTISFWLLSHQQASSFNFHFHYELAIVVFDCTISDTSTSTLNFYTNQNTTTESSSIDSFEGWNLHTVTISIDSDVSNRVNIDFYLNLLSIYSQFIDIEVESLIMNGINIPFHDANTNAGLILYEILVHSGLLNISELSSLFTSSSDCGCSYNCPTSFSTVCLSNYSKTQNKFGAECPASCSSSIQSCDVNLNCIPKSKPDCIYGLYDILTSECSLSPHCLTYHQLGDEYKCETTEIGYILDELGNCCICDTAYTKISDSPLVCINIPHCLDYIQDGVNYICSMCETGYRVDSQGNCNECDTAEGYKYSSDNTCIRIYQTDEESSAEDENDKVSTEQTELGEAIESSNSISTITSAVSTSVSSMISMDSNTLILYINTMQLLSFIQYLNIKFPFVIKKQQSSSSKFMQNINILSRIKINDKDLKYCIRSWMDDENSFLSKVIYQIIILALICIINLIIYYASRYGKEKLEQIASKALKHFTYTIYLQLYMITYLDNAYSASHKFVSVRSI